VLSDKQSFDRLRIGVWKLNRMMQGVRDIGRSDTDSMGEHDLQDFGLRLKGGILERRPSTTTGNNKLRVLEQQPPDRLNVVGLYCTLNCQQLPNVRLFRVCR
jgi:hypothetical protein